MLEEILIPQYMNEGRDANSLYLRLIQGYKGGMYPFLYAFQKRNNSHLSLFFVSEAELVERIEQIINKLKPGSKLRCQFISRADHASAFDVEIIKQKNGEVRGSFIILDSISYSAITSETFKRLSEKGFSFYRPSSEIANKKQRIIKVNPFEDNFPNTNPGDSICFYKKQDEWYWYRTDSAEKSPTPIDDPNLTKMLNDVCQDNRLKELTEEERKPLMAKMEELYLAKLYSPLYPQKDRHSCESISLDFAMQASKIGDLHSLVAAKAKQQEPNAMLGLQKQYLNKDGVGEIQVFSWKFMPKQLLKNVQSKTFLDNHTKDDAEETVILYSDTRHKKRYAGQFQWYVVNNISNQELTELAKSSPFSFVVTNNNQIHIISDGKLLPEAIFMEKRMSVFPSSRSNTPEKLDSTKQIKNISTELINFLSSSDRITLPELDQPKVTDNRHTRLVQQAMDERSKDPEKYDQDLGNFLTGFNNVDRLLSKAVPIKSPSQSPSILPPLNIKQVDEKIIISDQSSARSKGLINNFLEKIKGK
jgi:hypothetical protein